MGDAVTPLVIGIVVTVASALVSWYMVEDVRKNGIDVPTVGQLATNLVRQRLQRDLDAVQVVASFVAFGTAALAQGVVPQAYYALLIAVVAVIPVVSLVALFRTDPPNYDHVWFIFTPFTSLFLLAYVVALVSVTHAWRVVPDALGWVSRHV